MKVYVNDFRLNLNVLITALKMSQSLSYDRNNCYFCILQPLKNYTFVILHHFYKKHNDLKNHHEYSFSRIHTIVAIAIFFFGLYSAFFYGFNINKNIEDVEWKTYTFCSSVSLILTSTSVFLSTKSRSYLKLIEGLSCLIEYARFIGWDLVKRSQRDSLLKFSKKFSFNTTVVLISLTFFTIIETFHFGFLNLKFNFFILITYYVILSYFAHVTLFIKTLLIILTSNCSNLKNALNEMLETSKSERKIFLKNKTNKNMKFASRVYQAIYKTANLGFIYPEKFVLFSFVLGVINFIIIISTTIDMLIFKEELSNILLLNFLYLCLFAFVMLGLVFYSLTLFRWIDLEVL